MTLTIWVHGFQSAGVKFDLWTLEYENWFHWVHEHLFQSVTAREEAKMMHLRQSLAKMLQTDAAVNVTLSQNWELFTTTGEKISSINQFCNTRILFVLEGGAFVWPGVRPG